MSGNWGRRLWLGGIYLVISTLVIGGLGWVTSAALRLEREQQRAAVQAEHAERTRLALWRLDTRFSPALAREESRPFDHYVALHPPVGALRNDGQWWGAGMVWLPSPLLTAELPEWIRLYFQVDGENGWQSPQVIAPRLREILTNDPYELNLSNADTSRCSMLENLSCDWPAEKFAKELGPIRLEEMPSLPVQPQPPQPSWPPQQAVQPPPFPDLTRDFNTRAQLSQRGLAEGKGSMQNSTQNYFPQGRNGLDTSKLFDTGRKTVEVHIGPMMARWLRAEGDEPILILVRAVRVDRTPAYQGVILDWPGLKEVLRAEIADLFPNAELHPAEANATAPDRLMSALPVRLETGRPPEPGDPGRTTLRIGLGIAWMAALIALGAVGLGGMGLMSLSERRMRFASAVTHELRTPLTTLRLYLDMLANGMVKDPKRQQEYLLTLNAEADRLHLLIGNVLDFSRLEKGRHSVPIEAVPIGQLLDEVHQTWESRCEAAGKRLVLDVRVDPEAAVWAEAPLLAQTLGCLIDNAQKHTRGSQDQRIWLRAISVTKRTVALEVEDRGPGLLASKRRLFRPFRQGANTTGGVGLGLALAKRWTKMLGGKLKVNPGENGVGACFRIELRAAKSR